MRKRISLSLLFLIIGVAIYFIFDMEWLCKSNGLFTFIRNYFPDICWTFSFFFASIIFTTNITKKPLLINSIYVISISTFFEILQYFKVVRGTFDIVDILIYIISTITACLIEKLLRRKESEKV